MTVPYLIPESHWVCPNCDLTDVTHDPRPHSRMHNCPGLHGITAPMVADGIRCKVEAHEREDYTGGDEPHYDDEGKAIMSVITTRDEGFDCAVLAACAGFGLLAGD